MNHELRPGGDDALTYVTRLVDGRLSAVWSDGTVLPIARGGDGPNDIGGGGQAGAAGGQGQGQGGDAGTGAGDGKADGGQGDGGSGSGGDGDGKGAAGNSTLTMTQADLDALIDKRLGRAKSKWEADAKTAAERAKMDDAERAKAEKVDAEKAAADKVKGANSRVVKAEAKVAALAAGVDPKRLARFLKNVDLDDDLVNDDGEVDEAAVAKAVKAALDDVPEFRGAASSNGNGQGGGGASGGEFNGGGDKKVWTRKEIAALSVDEFEKHEAEIMAQMKAGTVK